MEEVREIDVSKVVAILTDQFIKQEKCSRQGHPNAYAEMTTVYGFQSRTHMLCPDCGARYKRPATPDELRFLDGCVDI